MSIGRRPSGTGTGQWNSHPERDENKAPWCWRSTLWSGSMNGWANKSEGQDLLELYNPHQSAHALPRSWLFQARRTVRAPGPPCRLFTSWAPKGFYTFIDDIPVRWHQPRSFGLPHEQYRGTPTTSSGQNRKQPSSKRIRLGTDACICSDGTLARRGTTQRLLSGGTITRSRVVPE